MSNDRDRRPSSCAPWCELGHGTHVGEEDHVHVGGQLCVHNTMIRLCSSVDPGTGAVDGPYVLMGADEFTLGEVDALVAALRLLAAKGRGTTEQAADVGKRVPVGEEPSTDDDRSRTRVEKPPLTPPSAV
jgi:hypothetical protein